MYCCGEVTIIIIIWIMDSGFHINVGLAVHRPYWSVMISIGFAFFIILLNLLLAWSIVEHTNEDVRLLENRCGTELAKSLIDYTKFHKEVLNGNGPQRYLVSVPVEAGLADRLIGIISQFWLAFFSKHAFQIGLHENLPRFEYAYDYAFVNWTRPPDESKYTAPLLFTYMGLRGYDGPRHYDPKEVSPTNFHMEYLINNDGRACDLFGKENLFEYPSKSTAYPFSAHTVFTSSNRGGIRYMFENPYLQKKLEDLKAKPETMFQCAYHFLFRENSEVEQAISPLRKKLLNPYNGNITDDILAKGLVSNMRIGIGIRAGDKSFDPSFDSTLRPFVYKAHTNCATSVQQSYVAHHFPSSSSSLLQYPWYAMSESLKTRQMLSQAFGEKIVVDTSGAYFHGDCQKHTFGGCQNDRLRQAIIGAVGQLKLFSMCNVHIVSDSGFPRVGVMLSKPPFHVYQTKSNRAINFGSCHYDHPVALKELMSVGAGF